MVRIVRLEAANNDRSAASNVRHETDIRSALRTATPWLHPLTANLGNA